MLPTEALKLKKTKGNVVKLGTVTAAIFFFNSHKHKKHYTC